VGDARVVTELCKDSWQGQSSTISPLTAVDRQAILETSKNWSLADLDVSAFSYAPVPFTFEQRIGTGAGAGGAVEMSSNGKSVVRFVIFFLSRFFVSLYVPMSRKVALTQLGVLIGFVSRLSIPRRF
jgi:hypothetical protein